jgi:hypothetical protein
MVDKSKLLALLLVFTSIAAQCASLTNLELEMLKASDLLQAGDAAAARELYKNLSEQESESWKKSLLAYDIGTSYLVNQEWLEALNDYDAVKLGDKPFPLLAYRLKTNMAIAHWRLAEKQMKEIDRKSPYFEEEYFNIFFLLKKTLINIEEAEKAYCELMEIEGEAYCVPSKNMEKLRLAVEQRRAKLYEEYTNDKIVHLSIKEALPLMMSGLTSLKEAVNYLGGIQMDRKIENEQIERIYLQSNSWIPLWDAIYEKVHDQLADEKRGFYDQAENNLKNALAELKEGSLDRSKSAVESARKSLNELFFSILEEDPIQDILKKILGEYDRAIASTEIQEDVLKSLFDQQRITEELFSRRNLPLEKLKVAQNQLDTALKYAIAGKSNWARIFLLVSYQQMQRISWEFEEEKGVSTEQVIEHVISEQSFSYILNNLRFDSLEKQEKEPLILVIEAQNEALNVANTFWNSVLKSQNRAYDKEGTEDAKENRLRCQFQPWSSVMPLFESGYKEATAALKFLKTDSWNRISKDHQRQALKYWKEALEKLKSVPPQESCESPPPSGGGASPKNEEPQNDDTQNSAQQPAKTSAQEILRLLQQMDQDDRQKGSEKKTVDLMEKAW